jgi:hypothetical protein
MTCRSWFTLTFAEQVMCSGCLQHFADVERGRELTSRSTNETPVSQEAAMSSSAEPQSPSAELQSPSAPAADVEEAAGLSGAQLTELKLLKIELQRYRAAIEAAMQKKIDALSLDNAAKMTVLIRQSEMLKQLTAENIYLRKVLKGAGLEAIVSVVQGS